MWFLREDCGTMKIAKDEAKCKMPWRMLVERLFYKVHNNRISIGTEGSPRGAKESVTSKNILQRMQALPTATISHGLGDNLIVKS